MFKYDGELYDEMFELYIDETDYVENQIKEKDISDIDKRIERFLNGESESDTKITYDWKSRAEHFTKAQ